MTDNCYSIRRDCEAGPVPPATAGESVSGNGRSRTERGIAERPSRAIFWWALLVIFAAFFAANHDVYVSRADAFTGTEDDMEQQAEGGNLLRRTAFLGLAGFGLVCLLLPVPDADGRSRRRPSLSSDFGRERERSAIGAPLGVLFGVFLAWCAASVLWADVPSMTMRRCLVLGCLVLGAAGIVRQLTRRELLHLAWIIPAAGLMIGISTELALGTFKPFTGDYRFAGTLHPNSQGLSLAAMCLAAFCLARESNWRQRRYLVVLGVGLVFLVLTKSRTSFAGVVIALVVLATVRTASGLKWSVGLAGLGSVCAAALVVLLFGIDVERELTDVALLGRKEQAASLTGRKPIWTILSDYVTQRPLVGYGYDSFWTPDRIETVSSELQWGVREAHSAYLDILLSVGVIGACLLAAVVLYALSKSWRNGQGVPECQKTGIGNQTSQIRTAANVPSFDLLLGLLIFGLINACTESGMIMPMFVPFLVVCGFLQLAAAESFARRTGRPLFAVELVHGSAVAVPVRDRLR